jgi:predicted nucleic acid-binding protein
MVEDPSHRIIALDTLAAEDQSQHQVTCESPENPLDKQIAATALLYDLTVVTRNTVD